MTTEYSSRITIHLPTHCSINEAIFALLLCFLSTTIAIHRNEMTYMFKAPQYIEIMLPDPVSTMYKPYRLFLYCESEQDCKYYSNEIERLSSTPTTTNDYGLGGTPIVFVHGHLGDFKQARSLASVAQWYRIMKQKQHRLYFYTIDYHDQASGFSGELVQRQYNYLSKVADFIYERHGSKTKLVAIGHSCGGVVVRSYLLNSTTEQRDSLALVITLSSPHRFPVAGVDYFMSDVYRRNDELAEKHQNEIKVPLMSIYGGARDHIVPSYLCNLNSVACGDCNLSRERRVMSIQTTAIPDVWQSLDHQQVVWFRPLVLQIIRGLYNVIESNASGNEDSFADRAFQILWHMFTPEHPVIIAPDTKQSVIRFQINGYTTMRVGQYKSVSVGTNILVDLTGLRIDRLLYMLTNSRTSMDWLYWGHFDTQTNTMVGISLRDNITLVSNGLSLQFSIKARRLKFAKIRLPDKKVTSQATAYSHLLIIDSSSEGSKYFVSLSQTEDKSYSISHWRYMLSTYTLTVSKPTHSTSQVGQIHVKAVTEHTRQHVLYYTAVHLKNLKYIWQSFNVTITFHGDIENNPQMLDSYARLRINGSNEHIYATRTANLSKLELVARIFTIPCKVHKPVLDSPTIEVVSHHSFDVEVRPLLKESIFNIIHTVGFCLIPLICLITMIAMSFNYLTLSLPWICLTCLIMGLVFDVLLLTMSSSIAVRRYLQLNIHQLIEAFSMLRLVAIDLHFFPLITVLTVTALAIWLAFLGVYLGLGKIVPQNVSNVIISPVVLIILSLLPTQCGTYALFGLSIYHAVRDRAAGFFMAKVMNSMIALSLTATNICTVAVHFAELDRFYKLLMPFSMSIFDTSFITALMMLGYSWFSHFTDFNLFDIDASLRGSIYMFTASLCLAGSCLIMNFFEFHNSIFIIFAMLTMLSYTYIRTCM